MDVKQMQSHLNTLSLSHLMKKDSCDVSSEYTAMPGKSKVKAVLPLENRNMS